MNGTVYENRLPRVTQVKKRLGTTALRYVKLVVKVHRKHIIRRYKPEYFEVHPHIIFGLSMPSNSAKPVCYMQR
jgi:hypothetical protein